MKEFPNKLAVANLDIEALSEFSAQEFMDYKVQGYLAHKHLCPLRTLQ